MIVATWMRLLRSINPFLKIKFVPRNDVRLRNSFRFSPFALRDSYAFTLAEVLIVLGIIGIVAELTIPTLMNNVQNQVTVVTVKKAYSTLSQAYTMAVQDNGIPDTWGGGGTLDLETGANLMINTFATYLKYTKE